jgi:hypothetical protein
MIRINWKFRLDIQITSTPIFLIFFWLSSIQPALTDLCMWATECYSDSFFWFSIFLKWKILPPTTAAPQESAMLSSIECVHFSCSTLASAGLPLILGSHQFFRIVEPPDLQLQSMLTSDLPTGLMKGQLLFPWLCKLWLSCLSIEVFSRVCSGGQLHGSRLSECRLKLQHLLPRPCIQPAPTDWTLKVYPTRHTRAELWSFHEAGLGDSIYWFWYWFVKIQQHFRTVNLSGISG